MKRLSLMLTAVVATGVLMAQAPTTALQTQEGTYQEAYVQQTGTSNYAEQTQIAVEENYSEVIQSVGNTYHTNYLNEAYTTQKGAHGEIYVTQTHGGYSDLTNTAIVKQRAESRDNYVDVNQAFGGNYAEVIQRVGSQDNEVDLDQSWGSSAVIKQEGSDNYVDLDQCYGASADIEQVGTDNVINLEQSLGAEATILQDGNDNTLRGIWCSETAESHDESTLSLQQIGDDNVLNLYQDDNSHAVVNQYGNDNNAVVKQNYSYSWWD